MATSPVAAGWTLLQAGAARQDGCGWLVAKVDPGPAGHQPRGCQPSWTQVQTVPGPRGAVTDGPRSSWTPAQRCQPCWTLAQKDPSLEVLQPGQILAQVGTGWSLARPHWPSSPCP